MHFRDWKLKWVAEKLWAPLICRRAMDEERANRDQYSPGWSFSSNYTKRRRRDEFERSKYSTCITTFLPDTFPHSWWWGAAVPWQLTAPIFSNQYFNLRHLPRGNGLGFNGVMVVACSMVSTYSPGRFVRWRPPTNYSSLEHRSRRRVMVVVRVARSSLEMSANEAVENMYNLCPSVLRPEKVHPRNRWLCSTRLK